MALIECDECGKDVSDKAVSCPNCGNPIAISEAVADDLQDDFIQNPKGEAIEEYKKKYSNLKRGLKRISIFASIIWAGCWYYNQEVTLKNWFGIYYGSDEYIYLGLFGLICIWVTQLFAYWIIGGFIKNEDEIVLEKEEIKEAKSGFLKIAHDLVHGVLTIALWLVVALFVGGLLMAMFDK